MRAVLKIEDIGNNERHIIPSRAWVKELYIKETVLSYHIEERWVKANSYDYSEANSVGSRGVYKYYWLEEGGIYQINSPESWGRSDNYYCLVINSEIKRVSKEVAESCLSLSLE
jgi:hypothetical protein